MMATMMEGQGQGQGQGQGSTVALSVASAAATSSSSTINSTSGSTTTTSNRRASMSDGLDSLANRRASIFEGSGLSSHNKRVSMFEGGHGPPPTNNNNNNNNKRTSMPSDCLDSLASRRASMFEEQGPLASRRTSMLSEGHQGSSVGRKPKPRVLEGQHGPSTLRKAKIAEGQGRLRTLERQGPPENRRTSMLGWLGMEQEEKEKEKEMEKKTGGYLVRDVEKGLDRSGSEWAEKTGNKIENTDTNTRVKWFSWHRVLVFVLVLLCTTGVGVGIAFGIR